MKIFNIRFIEPSGDGGYYSNHEQICEIYDKDSLNKDEIQWIIGEEELFEEMIDSMIAEMSLEDKVAGLFIITPEADFLLLMFHVIATMAIIMIVQRYLK